MRNLVRKLLMLYSVLFCLPSASMAQGYPVIDVTNWLAAIDQLYSNYDMVMNTIKQLEQAYQQYQFYLEQAKSWDLDNIQWDGDLDFRDEIKDVTRSVNKQLTNLRKIEEIFTTKQYSVGGMTFTVADLVGAGNDEKDLASVLKGVGKEFKNSWDYAADALVNGLSEEQGRAIWQKYGISPRNYTYMQQKKMMLKEVSSRIMASATEEAIAMQTEADLALSNEIVSQATTGEEHTEKELLQQILVLLRENRIGLSELESALNQASAQTAWQQAIEDEKEIQDMEAKARLKMESVTREQQDSMF